MKKRIAILTNSNTAIGGVETFVNQLKKKNGTITIFSDERKRSKLLKNPVCVGYHVGKKFLKEHRKKPFDSIVINGEYGWYLRWNRIKQKPVLFMHGNWPGFADNAMKKKTIKEKILYFYTKKVLGRIQKWSGKYAQIISISTNVKEQVKKYFSYDSILIPNGIDTHMFSPGNKQKIRKELKLSSNKPIILFVGSHTYSKGFDIIKKIAQEMPENNFVCILNTENKEKLPENIDIRNNQKYKLMKKYYQAADIFLFPSRFEGCSYVLLEAMATGIPCVISDVGYSKDLKGRLIREGIIKSFNYKIYKEKIGELLADKKKLKLMGEESRKFVKKYNELEVIKKQYEKVF